MARCCVVLISGWTPVAAVPDDVFNFDVIDGALQLIKPIFLPSMSA
jgi:hypothetical protein